MLLDMDSYKKIESGVSLEMANEAFYRNQADCYRNSEEYSRMISLYPVLKNSIGECKDERFIA